MKSNDFGVIHADEAYSKAVVIQRLGISQKFWDKMLQDGLTYTVVGHSRWVLGRNLIHHLEKHSQSIQSKAH